jgi:translation initiation factor IF-1
VDENNSAGDHTTQVGLQQGRQVGGKLLEKMREKIWINKKIVSHRRKMDG